MVKIDEHDNIVETDDLRIGAYLKLEKKYAKQILERRIYDRQIDSL